LPNNNNVCVIFTKKKIKIYLFICFDPLRKTNIKSGREVRPTGHFHNIRLSPPHPPLYNIKNNKNSRNKIFFKKKIDGKRKKEMTFHRNLFFIFDPA
jgi:hypothetical protein